MIWKCGFRNLEIEIHVGYLPTGQDDYGMTCTPYTTETHRGTLR